MFEVSPVELNILVDTAEQDAIGTFVEAFSHLCCKVVINTGTDSFNQVLQIPKEYTERPCSYPTSMIQSFANIR